MDKPKFNFGETKFDISNINLEKSITPVILHKKANTMNDDKQVINELLDMLERNVSTAQDELKLMELQHPSISKLSKYSPNIDRTGTDFKTNQPTYKLRY